jgi:flagellar hook-associated protein 3 FlgL
MQNNSLYNINNNKISEDQLNTMMSTGKKLTRPSDDPVIAIRALRLRSNVTQLSQYYEKNAKDAESWLNVTADALSTITSVLTDCVKQATKGASKDLTLDDLSIIITQMDALAKEYYSTGNVDYAGRYVFTGFRTDTALTFDRTTTADYRDINDEFNAENVQSSKRILKKHLLDSSSILDTSTTPIVESDICEVETGRLRLSYDGLNYVEGDGKSVDLKYREELVQPATASVDDKKDVINLTYNTSEGVNRNVTIPIDADGNYEVINDGIKYSAVPQNDGTYYIEATNNDTGAKVGKFTVSSEGVLQAYDGEIESAQTSKETRQVSTITYTSDAGQVQIKLPLLPPIGQTYEVSLDEAGFTATINSDGTYTIVDHNNNTNNDGTVSNTVIQVTGNGSINSSYKETTLTIGPENIIYATSSEQEIDDAYSALAEGDTMAVFNAATGEVLLNETLKDKLSTLPDLINAKTIDVIYDKKEWVDGDIRPENLFNCSYIDDNGKTILYNRGVAAHDIAYDVGFAQSVVVNTTADAVFTTSVKRDVNDLSRMLDELKRVDVTIKTLKDKLAGTDDENAKAKIQSEINAANKAFNYLRENIQKEFEHKITSNQNSLDVANVAVTDNGTKSKRLELINERLMNQTTTFKTLQSENEDIDLAEAATQLTTAQVTYEASLMATGKISQSSLINFI